MLVELRGGHQMLRDGIALGQELSDVSAGNTAGRARSLILRAFFPSSTLLLSNVTLEPFLLPRGPSEHDSQKTQLCLRQGFPLLQLCAGLNKNGPHKLSSEYQVLS